MSALLWIGALLAFAVGAAHSVLGERYLLIRLFRRENLPKLFGSDRPTRRILRFAWHLTTLAWWGFAAQMALAARAAQAVKPAGPDPAATLYLQALAVTFLASALVAGISSRGRHPAWIVFLAIAACAWWGG